VVVGREDVRVVELLLAVLELGGSTGNLHLLGCVHLQVQLLLLDALADERELLDLLVEVCVYIL